MAINENVKTVEMSKKVEESERKFLEVTIKAEDETRKAAFATFNRDLNLKNVALIEEKMKEKGYRVGEPIQVVKAEYAIQKGITAIVDINGEQVPSEKYENYFLVLDGSHRTHAASRYNDWLISQGKSGIAVPAIKVELIKKETVTEYCNEINCTKKEWSKEDYVNGAVSVYPNSELLQRYNELIKSESNPKGFSLSTLNLIFCNRKGLIKNDLVLLCSGVTQKGSKVKRDIIPASDIQTGNKFIKICKAKGFKDEEITKRYLIKEFNTIRDTNGGAKLALEVLDNITPDDVSTMTDNKGKLIEQNVFNHYKVMAARLQKS